jgi:hypothetical protein
MRYIINRNISILVFVIALVGIIVTSCEKYDTPASIRESLEDAGQDTSIVRKVLLINVDGGVGQLVKGIMPQNIASLLPRSKYSFDGYCAVAEGERNSGEEEPVSWAGMLTGVLNVKHKIKNNTYIPVVSMTPDAPDVVIDYYPTLLYRIRNNDPLARTICITPWQALNDRFLGDANKTITSISDEASKDSTVFSLLNEDYVFTMASFKGALEAGKANGFTATNAGYKSQIETIDGYIGEIVDAVKSRETYGKEDWLIIITSTNGGTPEGSYGGTSDEERNTFTIFHYMNFNELELNGTFITSPRFSRNVAGNVSDQEQRYALTPTDTMTIEMIFKVNAREDDGSFGYGNWIKVMGKKNWGFFQKWSTLNFRCESNTGVTIERGVTGFNDGLWHSFAVSSYLNQQKKSRTFKIYYNGTLTFTGDYDLDMNASAIDTSDFQIGGLSDIDFNAAVVRIWDTVLNEYEFDQNACLLEMTSTHPNYDRLIGYWNLLDQGAIKNDTVLASPIPGIPNMYLSGQPFTYSKSANTLACHFASDDIVVESETIAPQIFYWLNINPSSDWRLDRPEFLSKYDLEIYRPE